MWCTRDIEISTSFLQAFDRRPWTVNEQIKIIQDFLDVSDVIYPMQCI
jgi:hypothetical protein